MMLAAAVTWLIHHVVISAVPTMVSGAVSAFLGKWKWVLIGATVAAVAVFGALVDAHIARLEASNAKLQADYDHAHDVLAGYQRNEAMLKQTLADNTAATRVLLAQKNRAVEAITADRDRIAKEAASLKPLREKINEDACVGVPKPYRDVWEWVRNNPDTSGAGDRGAGPTDPARGPGGAASVSP